MSVQGAAVVLRGVTKEFGSGATRTAALHGIDLSVLQGELVLLVGPSGCGKTTLISIIAGLLEPTAGHVEVLGENVTRMSGGKRVRFRGCHIGFVFQQHNLLPAFTAVENVAVPLLIAGWRHSRARAKATELLVRMGLGLKLQHRPSQLSVGQQQRVAIARALVHEPRLLVCDEPTAALDSTAGQTAMSLFREVAVHAHRAVIIVTHDSRIYHHGDRIIEMSDGRIERVFGRTPVHSHSTQHDRLGELTCSCDAS